MVPDRTDSGEMPRPFSRDVEAALEAALLEAWQDGAPPESLRRAVKAAAHEAREHLLRPEEMLVAFKAMEQRLSIRLPERSRPGQADRGWMIRTLIEAYYRD